MSQEIDPQHSDIRDLLRVVGPLVVGVGLGIYDNRHGQFFFIIPQFWARHLSLPEIYGVLLSVCR